MLNPFEVNQVPGNRALVVLVNSAGEEAYAGFTLGILPALNHFGMPYRLVDIAPGEPLPPLAGESAGVVLGHDGVGAALNGPQQQALGEAVAAGLGIASLDGRLWASPPAVHDLFGIVALRQAEVTRVAATQTGHYIASMQEPGAIHQLKAPVEATIPGGMVPGFQAVAADGENRPLLVVRDRQSPEEGRRAALLFSPRIWLRQYLGHCMGLDDLLWRALVWIAAKPFPALMIPPFVVCRIDDASGSYDHFGYVDVLNEFSWIPNIGLFTDDIDQKDAAAIKRHFDAGTAEFSAHSFHEIGEPLPDQIYMSHNGQEYSLDQLRANFRRLDEFWATLDITPSRTINIHYDEQGLNSLPFLAARDQTFSMALIPYGVNWYANSYSWTPYPYGHQGFNYGPMDPDPRFWNAVGHFLSSYKTPEAGMAPGEFMGGNTVFANESPTNNVRGAIENGVRAVKTGVASGFFGTLMCHEQRIAAVSPQEWRAIIAGIADGLSGWAVIYRGYDEIAQYTKDKARTRITKALYDPATDNLITDLEGTVEAYLSCCVFRDHDDHCIYDLVDTPAFRGRYAFPE